MSRPIGLSVTGNDSLNPHQKESIMSVDGSDIHVSDHGDNFEESDNVFQTVPETELHGSLEWTDSDLKNLKQSSQACYCHGSIGNVADCTECKSHMKAPSRQEKFTDDTPQMHRTDESVWNSYAAKNLQALRMGSYTSEDSDSDCKENEKPSGNTPQNVIYRNLKAKCDSEPIIKHNSRKLVKAKSFCYPSDDESDEGTRYHSHVKFARKRSFCDVEQSPVRRASSADTGLTQEFRLLRFNGCEPFPKRSSSLPRTRIRFNSGSDTWKREPVTSKLSKEQDFERPECLRNVEKSSTDLPENLIALSADEQRLMESLSDTSATESDLQCKDKDVNNVFMHGLDSVDNIAPNEPILHGNIESFPFNKHLTNLKKPFVSSLRSESEVGGASLDISSINASEGAQSSLDLEDRNRSVFMSNNDSKHSRHR
jgi:hypothetical protein